MKELFISLFLISLGIVLADKPDYVSSISYDTFNQINSYRQSINLSPLEWGSEDDYFNAYIHNQNQYWDFSLNHDGLNERCTGKVKCFETIGYAGTGYQASKNIVTTWEKEAKSSEVLQAKDVKYLVVNAYWAAGPKDKETYLFTALYYV